MSAREVLMTPGTGRLPPRSSLPRDVVIPALPGLGVSWYDRGSRYWLHRAALALGMAVAVAVVVGFDVGLFGAMRRSSVTLFYVALGVDVAVSLGLLVFMARRTTRRWNVAALPSPMRPPAFRFGQGKAGTALSGVAQFLYPVALIVVAALLAIFPGLLIYVFLTSLLPQQPVERQARLWVAGELRRRGFLGGTGSSAAGTGSSAAGTGSSAERAGGDGPVRPDG
jgi:hypothetical protein